MLIVNIVKAQLKLTEGRCTYLIYGPTTASGTLPVTLRKEFKIWLCITDAIGALEYHEQ